MLLEGGPVEGSWRVRLVPSLTTALLSVTIAGRSTSRLRRSSGHA